MRALRDARQAMAARTPPRLVVTADRLAHGETGPQRRIGRRLPGRLARRGPVDAVQVRSFSAVETLRANLRTVTEALDRGDVAYTVLDTATMQRPVVVVTADRSMAAVAAMAALSAAMAPGVRVRPVGETVLRVFVEQAAGDLLLAGPELACDLVFAGPDTHPPYADLVRSPALDITFPIDAVYTWVDGSDPAWLARKQAAWSAQHPGSRHPLAANAARFTSREELRYSLRSLEMYAGWVREVFLVTDQQVPGWLRTDHPRLTVIDHREIFPADGSGLPTFNSHAIEARLHHIPGLADHYLYLNDDVFFGRPVAPDLFFAPGGASKFFVTPSALDDQPPSTSDRPVDAAAKVSRQLIEQAFQRDLRMKFQHVAHAQRRDVMTDLEARFAAELDRTVREPFRHPGDVSAAASLAHYYGLATDRAEPGDLTYLYCDIAERRAPIKLARLARERGADMFCLNDVGAATQVSHDPERLVRDFLTGYFPVASSFEADSPARAS
jgi:Stealth protein CR2, conserved region 2/Stealth protein CR3, conserved region 3/Stealth protein CR1, conserved region 1/Stealth protein CR4, conserved region 4